MAITSKQKHELKKFLKELGKHRGSHTELVSVYVPAGYDMNLIINHLQQEQGTATNIKSKSTQKNVIDALERMIQHLRLFKRTPENGLAAFSGNVSEREGQSDVEVWSIEPPIPLNLRLYRCDKRFILDEIIKMVEDTEVYGMVVLDRRDASLALLKGKAIVPVVKTHSEVPGKTRAGGQSAQRFERLREGAAKEHFKKIAEYMKNEFLNPDIKGILLGGPGTTVNSFLNKGYITGDVKKKIVGIKDLSYTGEFGLQELLDKAQDVLADEEVAKEKKIMKDFFTLLATKPGMVSYGEDETRKTLEMGAVRTLLLSEELEDSKAEELEKKAAELGTEVFIVSIDTREGVQLKDIGKIAAILRYEMHS